MSEDNDRLRWQLKRLRQDTPPSRDLWPDIAAQIAPLPLSSTQNMPMPLGQIPPRSADRGRRWIPWAMAASVLLAFGWVWQMTHLPPSPQMPLIQHEAVLLTQDYQGALAQINVAEVHPELGSALQELDRSAEDILAALEHAPNARFLLEQLRRTYAKRLALTQRAVMS